MKTLLSLLLGLSLSGTVLALTLMLLRRIFRDKLPSAFYYYAWLLVLLRFVLPLPGLMPSVGESRAASAPAPATVYTPLEDTNAARPYESGFYHAGTGSAEVETPRTGTALPTVEALESIESEPVARTGLSLSELREVLRSERFWLSVWIIGMACALVRYLGGYLRFRRELDETLLRPSPADRAVYDAVSDEPRPRLYRSRAVRTPMLVGVFRPLIVLPDCDYSEEMLQGVLAHELTHFRRHDVLYKWFAVLVVVVHWFNPVTRLFRYELDRSCELACDETLLRRMDAGEKQLYGDMLIAMAADRRLPRTVVATSFAVEKRNLKERLQQIMSYKKRGRASLALILIAVLLLSACGAAAGPGAPLRAAAGPVAAADVAPAVETAAPKTLNPVPTPEPPEGSETFQHVEVDSIDAFLAALGSNTIIVMQPGVYDLSAASDYGREHADGPYTWLDAYDGYELVIRHVDKLSIIGDVESSEEVILSAVPRYAEVLRFENCSGLILSSFTAGHTQEPGQCAGGVLEFDSCTDTQIANCRLYGCGVLGIQTENCDRLSVYGTEIYECSSGAVSSVSSRDLRFINCVFRDCGRKDGGSAYSMFIVRTTTGFAVVNSEVYNNIASFLLSSTSSDEVYLLGTGVGSNRFSTSYFSSNLLAPVVDGCSFTDARTPALYDDFSGVDHVLSLDGDKLYISDLLAMSLAERSYDGPTLRPTAAVTGIPVQDGVEYHVTTVDELLAAIGSDTTIYLDNDMFDWSTATNYGGYGGEHYYWVDIYDGPGLVITGVSNLRLIGQGKDATTVQAVPRYADVIAFESCRNVTVANLTAGHLKGEPGSCSGDVLAFESCQDFHIVDCGLFGCGVYGVRANNCVTGSVLRTEIYECSGGAAQIFRSDGVVFTDCSVHDCKSVWDFDRGTPVNRIFLSDSGDCIYNGVALLSGQNEVGDGSVIGAVDPWQETNAEAIPYPGSQLSLYYYEMQFEPNASITMRADDSPITLNAALNWVGSDPAPADLKYRWLTSNSDALGLTPSADGMSCELSYLAPAEGGVGLLVVAESSSSTAVASLTVYLR